jgi:hypothetical protein
LADDFLGDGGPDFGVFLLDHVHGIRVASKKMNPPACVPSGQRTFQPPEAFHCERAARDRQLVAGSDSSASRRGSTRAAAASGPEFGRKQ